MSRPRPAKGESLQIRPLSPADTPCLEGFFRSLQASEGARFFHPHPLDSSTAKKVCAAPGEDYFCGAFLGVDLRGYGMLRGWNEGFAIPSLGLAVHPEYRGKGAGGQILEHLHRIALSRGCHRIRLTVYRENGRAMQLFTRAGYRVAPGGEPRAVAWLDLFAAPPGSSP